MRSPPKSTIENLGVGLGRAPSEGLADDELGAAAQSGGGASSAISNGVRNHAPLGFAGIARLVADPADVGLVDGDVNIGRQRVDEFIPSISVIRLACAGLGVGSVEPHFRNLAVFGQQLVELIEEVAIVVV